MNWPTTLALLSLAALASGTAIAGGSSYGISPGTKTLLGKVAEWPVPTPRYARDPVPAPDGTIYFSEMEADRIARFNPKSQKFQEWNLRAGTKPRGLVVAGDGRVFFGSAGYGVIGEFDPATGKVREYIASNVNSEPYTLAFDAKGDVWFTGRKTGIVGRVERSSGKVSEFSIGADPYGVVPDLLGYIWVTRRTADRLSRLDPQTGQVVEVVLPPGSQPRRAAVSPDGMLWISLYGTGRLAKVNCASLTIVNTYLMPGGPNAGPYAVTADGGGRIWVSEIQTDSVAVFDAQRETFRVLKLPTKDTGVRKATIDASGRFWYVGSHSGKIGVID